MNAVLYQYMSLIFFKWAKPPQIFEKTFKILKLKQQIVKHRRFENKLLATWFIFELVGVRLASDLVNHKPLKKFLSKCWFLEPKI